MNKCGFIGRLGQDIKFYPAQGTKKAFCTFSLGVKRPGGWKDAQGKDITDWLDFTASAKTAELIQQYAGTKGTMIAITDCVAMKESFKDKQGNDRQTIKFFIKEVDLSVTFAVNNANGNGGNSSSGGGQGYSNNNNNNNNNGNSFSRGRNQAPANEPYSPDVQDDGDLPF